MITAFITLPSQAHFLKGLPKCSRAAARSRFLFQRRIPIYQARCLSALSVKDNNLNSQRKPHNTSAVDTPPHHHDITVHPPSRAQLRDIMLQSALPMVGFGFMDQTIMIHSGHAIDCSIGVYLGLSTLAAAAVGQCVANTGALLFGESIPQLLNRFFKVMEPIPLSPAQQALPIVKRTRFSGTFLGILLGGVLGLANLLFIDTGKPKELKMTKELFDKACLYEVTASNTDSSCDKYRPATTLKISGPDVDGLLAVVLTGMKDEGYSVLEMTARPTTSGDGSEGGMYFEDVFIVRRNGEAVPEQELSNLVRKILREKISILKTKKKKT